MKWTKETRAEDGRLLLLSKYLVKFFGRRIDLHQICDFDPPETFHSHPANAIRVILWGSYLEQLEDGSLHRWRPGMIGYVPGPILHRIDRVHGPCFTLWLRGRDRFEVRTRNITKFLDIG